MQKEDFCQQQHAPWELKMYRRACSCYHHKHQFASSFCIHTLRGVCRVQDYLSVAQFAIHVAGGTGQRSERQFWSPTSSLLCKTASSASSSVTAWALDTTTSGEGRTETSSSISCDLEIRINTEDRQGLSNAARTAGKASRVSRSSGVFGAAPPRKLEPMMTSKRPEEAAKSLIEL